MELRAVRIETSPRERGWRRLSGDVTYGDGATESYWLDVPDAFAGELSPTADAFLTWLAPLAATVGEDLRSAVACDPALLEGLRKLMPLWAEWHAGLRVVRVDAPTETRARADRNASFFSGGIDSFFTALAYGESQHSTDALELHDHIVIWGFDVPLENAAAFARVGTSVEQVAHALGRELVPVVTNVRATRFKHADWSMVTHGPALAGVAHALAGRFASALIPSSISPTQEISRAGFGHLEPWGSHPVSDPLMSSDRVHIVNDGSAFTRVEKTEFVAHHPLVRDHLRVCYHDDAGGNCGHCNKCYRTMMTLEALGVLEESKAFDRRWLDLRRAGRIYCPNKYDLREFRFVRQLAQRVGRADIVRAVDDSLRRSAKRQRLIERMRGLRDAPVFWRWAPAWEQRLLRGWIT